MPSVKRLAYLVGYVAAGVGLYYIIAPSNNDNRKQINKDQGILNKDMSDAERNNQMLIQKLQRGAGLDPEGKS